MNKFLQKIHHLFCQNLTKNSQVDALKTKIIQERRKDIREIKKTNGIIKIMIEKGEFDIKIK